MRLAKMFSDKNICIVFKNPNRGSMTLFGFLVGKTFMYRQIVLITLILCLLSLRMVEAANRAYAAERVIVSVIYSSNSEPYQQAWEGFKSYLSAKNIALWVSKYNLSEQGPEKIIDQITAEKPQIIFALGTKAASIAQVSFKNIPIVFALVLEPEFFKGINVTGVLMDISAKMKLEQVKRLFPGISNLGLVFSDRTAAKAAEFLQACNELGLKLITKKIDSEKQLPEAIREIKSQIDIFIMVPDTKIYFPQSVKYLLQESLRQKFPVVGLSRYYSKDGAVISFDCDYLDLGKQAGELAIKIIDGINPAAISLVMPRKINYSLNLVVAKNLGIKFPLETIKTATFIYEETVE
jgi:putative tryptophan/tyrosine transport system substrate-binding protein